MRFKEFLRRVLPPIVVDAARWLLQSRKLNSPIRVRFQYGQFSMKCDSSHRLPMVLKALPNFGRNLADVVVALGVQEPRVIDIGANIGDTAILLARFAPGAKVLCIEGDSRFMSYLDCNTAQIGGVTIAEAILADRSAQVSGEFVAKNGTAHVVLGEGRNVLQVEMLDDLLTAYPEFSYPDIIKIDTDGFEPAIMRGAQAVLAASKPVVFYEWHPDLYHMAGEDDTGHADFLMELGYDGFMIFVNTGELLLRVLRPSHEILGSLAQFSRTRRRIDNWHFDVAAFPTERLNAWERLWVHYSN